MATVLDQGLRLVVRLDRPAGGTLGGLELVQRKLDFVARLV